MTPLLADGGWAAFGAVLVALITAIGGPAAMSKFARVDRKVEENSAHSTEIDNRMDALTQALAEVSVRLQKQERQMSLLAKWADQIVQWAASAYERLRHQEPNWPAPPKMPNLKDD